MLCYVMLCYVMFSVSRKRRRLLQAMAFLRAKNLSSIVLKNSFVFSEQSGNCYNPNKCQPCMEF